MTRTAIGVSTEFGTASEFLRTHLRFGHATATVPQRAGAHSGRAALAPTPIRSMGAPEPGGVGSTRRPRARDRRDTLVLDRGCRSDRLRFRDQAPTHATHSLEDLAAAKRTGWGRRGRRRRAFLPGRLPGRPRGDGTVTPRDVAGVAGRPARRRQAVRGLGRVGHLRKSPLRRRPDQLGRVFPA